MALEVTTDREGIKRRILQFVETYTGLAAVGAGRVIWAEQNVEKRPLPMATIQISSDGLNFGADEVLDEFNAGVPELTRRTRGPRRMTVTVQAYDLPITSLDQTDPLDRLANMVAVLRVPQVIEENRDACISIIDHSPIVDVSTVVGERWERRGSVDLFVLYTAETTDAGLTDGWIDTIEPITTANGNLIINE